jgi:hypothetical protein
MLRLWQAKQENSEPKASRMELHCDSGLVCQLGFKEIRHAEHVLYLLGDVDESKNMH